MPRRYKRYCNYCAKYYKGQGKYFCSVRCCSTYFGPIKGYKKGHIPWSKGRTGVFSKETLEAMSKSRIGKYCGKNSYNYGRKTTEATKKLLSKIAMGRKKSPKAHSFQKGENHWNWKGGNSVNYYGSKWTKELRTSIKERDYYKCWVCENTKKNKALIIHHINLNKTDHNPDNLITLCCSCHQSHHYEIQK